MTESAITKIVEEARSRWQVMDCTVIHRYGELQPNDQIVLVAVASAHRGDAFAACEFIMDYLKTRAPFWKKEHRPRARAGSKRASPTTRPPSAGSRIKQQQRLLKPWHMRTHARQGRVRVSSRPCVVPDRFRAASRRPVRRHLEPPRVSARAAAGRRLRRRRWPTGRGSSATACGFDLVAALLRRRAGRAVARAGAGPGRAQLAAPRARHSSASRRCVFGFAAARACRSGCSGTSSARASTSSRSTTCSTRTRCSATSGRAIRSASVLVGARSRSAGVVRSFSWRRPLWRSAAAPLSWRAALCGASRSGAWRSAPARCAGSTATRRTSPRTTRRTISPATACTSSSPPTTATS